MSIENCSRTYRLVSSLSTSGGRRIPQTQRSWMNLAVAVINANKEYILFWYNGAEQRKWRDTLFGIAGIDEDNIRQSLGGKIKKSEMNEVLFTDERSNKKTNPFTVLLSDLSEQTGLTKCRLGRIVTELGLQKKNRCVNDYGEIKYLTFITEDDVKKVLEHIKKEQEEKK